MLKYIAIFHVTGNLLKLDAVNMNEAITYMEKMFTPNWRMRADLYSVQKIGE